MTMTQQIFARLKGTWVFKRLLSAQGSVKGIAYFKAVKPGVLNYSEQGQWLHQGRVFEVSREYQYRYDADNDKLSVYFLEQGKADRFFHEISLLPKETDSPGIKAVGEHQCAHDHYQAHYRFIDYNNFFLLYHVKGPSKDYVSETTFKRVS